MSSMLRIVLDLYYYRLVYMCNFGSVFSVLSCFVFCLLFFFLCVCVVYKVRVCVSTKHMRDPALTMYVL